MSQQISALWLIHVFRHTFTIFTQKKSTIMNEEKKLSLVWLDELRTNGQNDRIPIDSTPPNTHAQTERDWGDWAVFGVCSASLSRDNFWHLSWQELSLLISATVLYHRRSVKVRSCPWQLHGRLVMLTLSDPAQNHCILSKLYYLSSKVLHLS